MALSYKLRKKLIDCSGYWFYKRRHLPVGADFVEDVKIKLNVEPQTIFDVGANYGQTALFLAENFPSARIFSFEPITNSFQKLVTNTKHLSQVSCYPTALGDAEKTVEIPIFDQSQSQLNSLKWNDDACQLGSAHETISVTTVDSFVTAYNINSVGLLKIDTEGYEVEVLAGARNTIAENKIKLILCEVSLSPTNKRNTPLNQVIEFLEPYNYTLLGLYETNINHLKDGFTYSNALFVKP